MAACRRAEVDCQTVLVPKTRLEPRVKEELGLLHEVVSDNAGAERTDETIRMVVRAVRRHLRMDIAYVSEFADGKSIVRHADAPDAEALFKLGEARSLDDVFCRHVLEGRLPPLMADTADYPLTRDLSITSSVPIRSHISVPILRGDGTPYGTFCCIGFEPHPSLNERDLELTRAFAEIVSHHIVRGLDRDQERLTKRNRILAVISGRGFSVLFQPIWHFEAARPEAFECLARFSAIPGRPPDVWFAEAAEVGLGIELELAVIGEALRALPRMPADTKLALNASPPTILDRRFREVLDGAPLDRLKIEVTEHAPIDDYARFAAALAPFRALGAELAVDDAGAGFSSFRHIINLKPDLIKLDIALTRDIDKDAARRALTSALIYYARETGSEIIAEGIETEDELKTLRSLGILRGQGYLLGRPETLARAAAHGPLERRLSSAAGARAS